MLPNLAYKPFMCAPPWAFPWDQGGGRHIQSDHASLMLKMAVLLTTRPPNDWIEKIYHLSHPCQPPRHELEGENKEETITKIPLCLNHYLLDIFVLWPSTDFWSK